MPITVGEEYIINGITYAIKKIIGRGGLSTVYYAIDESSETPVAIKDFSYIKFYDPITKTNDCEDYWENEILNTQAQARSGLHCVQVLNYEKRPDLQTPEYIIVLSYIQGSTFLDFYREFVQKCSGLQNLDIASIVRYIFIPLAELLDYCHSKEHIVHRDFSLNNIIIQTDDEGSFWPVLIDWGVSKHVGPEWIYYTPKPYMTPAMPRDIPIVQKGAPPEIRFGYMPTAASDIYYLAHLMYFVFTGGIMREDSELLNQDSYVLNPKGLNWYIPTKYNEVVKKMTQYEPADRPKSMQEVILILRELVTINEVHFDFEIFFDNPPDTDPLTGKRITPDAPDS